MSPFFIGIPTNHLTAFVCLLCSYVLLNKGLQMLFGSRVLNLGQPQLSACRSGMRVGPCFSAIAVSDLSVSAARRLQRMMDQMGAIGECLEILDRRQKEHKKRLESLETVSKGLRVGSDLA